MKDLKENIKLVHVTIWDTRTGNVYDILAIFLIALFALGMSVLAVAFVLFTFDWSMFRTILILCIWLPLFYWFVYIEEVKGK